MREDIKLSHIGEEVKVTKCDLVCEDMEDDVVEGKDSVDGLFVPPDTSKIPNWVHGLNLILLSFLLIGIAVAAVVNLSRSEPPHKDVWISMLSSIITLIIPSPLQMLTTKKD